MKFKLLIIAFLAFLAVVPADFSWLGAAEDGAGLKIEEIKLEKADLPREVDKASGNKALGEDWQMVQVKFSTEEEITEEIQIKVFLEGYDSRKDEQFVILTSEITYINIPKGSGHLAYFYLPPGSALRYGGKGGKDLSKSNVHVDFLENGRMVAQEDKNKDEPNWYSAAQQISGVLMSLKESPFWPSQAAQVNHIKVSRN
jgi:transcription antitermination factor NusG